MSTADYQSKPGVYWASESEDRIGDAVRSKVRAYRLYCESTGRTAVWRRAMRAEYGLDVDGGHKNTMAVTFEGKEGEIVSIRANIFRTLVRATVVLMTGSRPSFTCRPRAYDAQTTELVGLGNAVMDAYLDRDAEACGTKAAHTAILYGNAAVGVYWDAQAGELLAMDPESGQQAYQGDVVYEAYRPDQVALDVAVETDRHEWVIVNRKRNRWALAAEYPQHAEHIINAPAFDATYDLGIIRWNRWAANEQNRDQIIVQELYHRSCPALPGGRGTLVVDGVAIADGPNPYGVELPVFMLRPSPEPDCAFGYGESWDLLALQTMIDSVISQAMTMQENFGMVDYVVPEGGNIDVEQLSRGTRAVYSNTAPTVLEGAGRGVANAVEAAGFLISLAQQIRSMNETSLGTGSGTPSGTSVAQQMQITIRNNAGVVRSYLALFRDIMRATLRNVQMFATEERVVHIVGKNNQQKVRRFKGADLKGLEGVDIELGSLESRTSETRHQVTTELLGAGLLKTPEEALEMMATGRLEPAMDGPAALEAQIERENEMLANGQEVLVLDEDCHAEHIRRHRCILFDPETRQNPQLVFAVQQHINMHSQTWNSLSLDPIGLAKLAATGQQPSPGAQLQMQMQMAGAMGAGGPGMPAMPPPPADAGNVDPGAPTQNPNVADATTNPANESAALPPDARPIPTTYQ
jgi:hypothetical protein